MSYMDYAKPFGLEEPERVEHGLKKYIQENENKKAVLKSLFCLPYTFTITGAQGNISQTTKDVIRVIQEYYKKRAGLREGNERVVAAVLRL